MEQPRDLDQLCPRIASGDPEAFAYWLAAAERPLRDSMRPFAEVVDVEAVLQETMLRIWQVAARFVTDGRPNGLLRLGARIARSLCLEELRRAGSPIEEPHVADDVSVTTPKRSPDPLLRRLLRECRERLPNKPASALSERLGAEGESDEQLAERVGMRVNTFRQNVTRARALLRECLERHGIDLDEELK